ncbi:uncharacterized protein LOC144327471 isoform X3 [Podarcis muralis]
MACPTVLALPLGSVRTYKCQSSAPGDLFIQPDLLAPKFMRRVFTSALCQQRIFQKTNKAPGKPLQIPPKVRNGNSGAMTDSSYEGCSCC